MMGWGVWWKNVTKHVLHMKLCFNFKACNFCIVLCDIFIYVIPASIAYLPYYT